MTDVNFTVEAAFDRKLFWERGASVRYLVARIKARRASDKSAAERAPLNIALVIDASGSMDGGKLDAAKQAALGLAERLTDTGDEDALAPALNFTLCGRERVPQADFCCKSQVHGFSSGVPHTSVEPQAGAIPALRVTEDPDESAAEKTQ